MDFLLNNIFITLVLLIIVGFSAFFMKVLINEVVLNKALNLKHQQMRITGVVKGVKARITGLTLATLVPMAVVVAVVIVGTNPTITQTNNIISLSSSNDILSLYNDFNDKFDNDYTQYFERGIFGLIGGAPEDAVDEGALDGSLTNDDAGSDDFSEVNNQVVGVDEMDNVVTDGKYIYSMFQNKVQITLAYTIVDEIDVLSLYKTFEYSSETCSEEQFYPQGMFVDDDYFVVIGNQYNYNCDSEPKYPGEDGEDILYDYYYWGYESSSIKVLVYDKSEDFELRDEYTMNGYFTGTRKIGDSLYIVTNQYIPFGYGDDEIDVNDYLPTYEVAGIKVTADYEDIIYLEGTSPDSFTTFYGIDLESREVDMEVVLGDSGYNLYVSNENMYLVGRTYYFWPMLDFVNVEDPVYETKTAILKVAIGNANVEYETLGLVEGNTLDQFSMDEHNGYLRITTTEGWWGEEINNRLFILDEDLIEVSRIENIGEVGELIKSTRFVGDYAYVVTFEQTDPFYVVNLSDPDNPFIQGELKIDGYSAYLQPLGENYMLGIGYGDNSGGTNGLKIAIFDVTDKSNPVPLGEDMIIDYEQMGWGYSTALYNHKDLLVSVSKGIIALPFSGHTYSYEDGYSYNSGIKVYNFDFVNGLSEAGFVQHSENSVEDVYVYKSKFISEYFYTVSNKYIKVSYLNDVETILNSVALEE